jgi:hypothetical protein
MNRHRSLNSAFVANQEFMAPDRRRKPRQFTLKGIPPESEISGLGMNWHRSKISPFADQLLVTPIRAETPRRSIG